MREDDRIREMNQLWNSIVGVAAIGFIWITYIVGAFYVR